jgi:hypothetical protein
MFVIAVWRFPPAFSYDGNGQDYYCASHPLRNNIKQWYSTASEKKTTFVSDDFKEAQKGH